MELVNWTAQNDIIYHIIIGEDKTNKTGYAFHFDAKLTANYLKTISVERGINHIDGTVKDINSIDYYIDFVYNETKPIKMITLENT